MNSTGQPPNLGEVLQMALQNQQQGNLAKAEELYRVVLQAIPNQPDALNLLGLLYSDQKRFALAEDMIRQAISAHPSAAQFHNNLGAVCEAQGKLEQAEACYRKAIELNPDYAEAHNNLGNVFHALGRPGDAVTAYRQAIKLRSNYVNAFNNLGSVLSKQNELVEAEACFRQALALLPDHPLMLKNLAETLVAQGRLQEAEQYYRNSALQESGERNIWLGWADLLCRYRKRDEAAACLSRQLETDGENPELLRALGNIYSESGRLDKAIPHFSKLAELQPDNYELLTRLGNAFKEYGMCFYDENKKKPLIEKSLMVFQKALQLQDSAEAINNVGSALLELESLEEAAACFKRAIELKPDLIEAYFNRGLVFEKMGDAEEAYRHFQHVLHVRPDFSDACHHGLVRVLENTPDVPHAIASLRLAIASMPNAAELQSVLAYATDIDPSATPQVQQEERRRWYENHIGPNHPGTLTLGNIVNPNRKIRIGYIPGRFYRNASAYIYAPMLLDYDKAKFEVYCYSNFDYEDDLTRSIRQNVDGWRSIARLSDEESAHLIRDDAIDILVDLFGHAGANRLPIYAYKPAPIQVSAWGHANGTGMPEMDYLFSDPVSIPTEERHLYAEEIIDLPCQIGYWCPEEAPPVSELPALTAGHVTFGCFNLMSKVSDQALETWAELLADVSNSRLILKDKGWGNPVKRSQVQEIFHARGVGADRITFMSRTGWYAHLKAYDDVDIALDPFPKGGGMTTLDALWMGVPVVCMRGDTLGKRITSAISSAVGLDDWVATSHDEYLAIAGHKADNLAGLSALRRSLRALVFSSPLGHLNYVRHVESRYREMWKRWCTSGALLSRQAVYKYKLRELYQETILICVKNKVERWWDLGGMHAISHSNRIPILRHMLREFVLCRAGDFRDFLRISHELNAIGAECSTEDATLMQLAERCIADLKALKSTGSPDEDIADPVNLVEREAIKHVLSAAKTAQEMQAVGGAVHDNYPAVSLGALMNGLLSLHVAETHETASASVGMLRETAKDIWESGRASVSSTADPQMMHQILRMLWHFDLLPEARDCLERYAPKSALSLALDDWMQLSETNAAYAETITTEPKNTYVVGVSIWGEKYLNFFLGFHLPSLLAEGNLPYLAQVGKVIFSIATDADGRQFIERSPVYSRLAEYADIHFTVISQVPGRATAEEASSFYMRYGLLDHYHVYLARNIGANLVLMPPDTVISHAGFYTLASQIDAGFDCCTIACIEAYRDAVEPILRTYREDDVIAVDADVLSAIAVRHKTDYFKSLIMGEDHLMNAYPREFFWRVPGGYVCHSIFMHPIILSSRTMSREFHPNHENVDWALLPRVMQADGRVKVLDNASELFILHCSDRDVRAQEYSAFNGKITPRFLEYLLSVHQHDFPIHRRLFGQPQFFQCDDPEVAISSDYLAESATLTALMR